MTALIGLVALGTTAFGFTIRDDGLLQKVNLAGCVLWMTHFALLEAPVASGMMLLAIVMIASAVLKLDKVSVWAWRVNLALLPIMALLIMLGLQEPTTFAPVLAGFLINTGVARCAGWKMTAMIALGAVLWATTGLLVGSWPALFANVLNLCALSLRASRGRRKQEEAPVALEDDEVIEAA